MRKNKIKITFVENCVRYKVCTGGIILICQCGNTCGGWREFCLHTVSQTSGGCDGIQLIAREKREGNLPYEGSTKAIRPKKGDIPALVLIVRLSTS